MLDQLEKHAKATEPAREKEAGGGLAEDEIEQLVRTKANKVQHGYLAVIVKKNTIIPTDVKDAFGGQIIKVKEGSLHVDRLVAFTHNDIDYTVNEEGDIVKKKTP